MGSPGAARSTALQATVRAAEADHARLGHDRTQDRLAQIITYLPRPSTPGGDGRLRQTPSCPRTRCQALALPPALAPRRAPGRLHQGRWPSAACPCPPPPPFLSPARTSRSPEGSPQGAADQPPCGHMRGRLPQPRRVDGRKNPLEQRRTSRSHFSGSPRRQGVLHVLSRGYRWRSGAGDVECWRKCGGVPD